MPATSINVSLAVMFVTSGGNTCDGRYFYSFTPATINVTAPDTVVVFTLSPDTAARFQIVDLYASDNGGNLSGLKKSSDRRTLSIVNSNKMQQLVFISLLVMDGDMRINCDPQMTNTPTGSGA
jgi:hypothetical protein